MGSKFKVNEDCLFINFRVCKSMHHHTFKWINQPDAAIYQVYYLLFKYSSTCFGHPHAHHQELNNCSRSLWFYRWSMVIAVLLVVVGPVVGDQSAPILHNRPDHDQQHCCHHTSMVKPEAATAVVELLMMGMRMPKTWWAVFKRQIINLRNCCIWLVDSFERGTVCFAQKISAVIYR